MSTHIKHNHLVVIGRIPDEENVCIGFRNLTIEEATAQFQDEMVDSHIDNQGLEGEAKQEVKDEGVYIDAVLTSETPIGIDWRC